MHSWRTKTLSAIGNLHPERLEDGHHLVERSGLVEVVLGVLPHERVLVIRLRHHRRADRADVEPDVADHGHPVRGQLLDRDEVEAALQDRLDGLLLATYRLSARLACSWFCHHWLGLGSRLSHAAPRSYFSFRCSCRLALSCASRPGSVLSSMSAHLTALAMWKPLIR